MRNELHQSRQPQRSQPNKIPQTGAFMLNDHRKLLAVKAMIDQGASISSIIGQHGMIGKELSVHFLRRTEGMSEYLRTIRLASYIHRNDAGVICSTNEAKKFVRLKLRDIEFCLGVDNHNTIARDLLVELIAAFDIDNDHDDFITILNMQNQFKFLVSRLKIPREKLESIQSKNLSPELNRKISIHIASLE